MRCFLLGFVGFFLAALMTTIAMSLYADYAARASLLETLLRIDPLRDRVAEALIREPHSVVQPAEAIAGVSYLKVTADGTIVFRSLKHGQIMVLEPKVQGRGVSWRCIGAPAKDVPPDCR